EGIDSRHDERAEIRAHEPALAKLRDDLGDLLFDLEDGGGALLVDLDRLRDGLIREVLDAPEHGVICAAREAAVLFVADADRHERWIFEVERDPRLFLAVILLEEPAVDADDLERALLQIVRLLRVEREDLPSDVAFGEDQRRDRLGAQPAHRLEAV